MAERRLEGWPHKRHEYDSIAHFLSSEIPQGILTIDYNGIPLDILNRSIGADTTVIMFHAALSRKVRSLPVFAGNNVTGGLNANIVCVSDPSLCLDTNLMLSWFAGNSKQELQRVLPEILQHLIFASGAKNVVFFGASGGGFASMFYSQQFPDSLSIALNPQVILGNYPAKYVRAYTHTCFGANTAEASSEVLATRICSDLRVPYTERFDNTVALMQNTRDSHHMNRHFGRFLSSIPRTSRMNIELGDWGSGHVPPPKAKIVSLLAASVKAAPAWSVGLKKEGFVADPGPTYGASASTMHSSG